jgi:DNA-binding Lrp family transcriptional regulator
MNAEQRILAWLERADFDGTGCRWSQENIAAACGCSRRTVIRATQKLADEGRIHSFLIPRPKTPLHLDAVAVPLLWSRG